MVIGTSLYVALFKPVEFLLDSREPLGKLFWCLIWGACHSGSNCPLPPWLGSWVSSWVLPALRFPAGLFSAWLFWISRWRCWEAIAASAR